jgi:release factor glutamine methyltransferase
MWDVQVSAGRRTIEDALEWGQEVLERAGIAGARGEAELMLEACLGVSKAHLYAHPERELAADEWARLREWVFIRSKHEPVWYVIGRAWFMGLEFLVDRRVLIPRHETEVLAGEALREAGKSQPRAAVPDRLRIADVCTGSGCLAIYLSLGLKQVEIFATDISRDALDVARENARRHGVLEAISFTQGSYLEPVPSGLDMVVANPPYVSTEQMKDLPPEVRDYEPRLALHAGPKGTEAIGAIATQAADKLKPGGLLLMEIGFGQGGQAREILKQNAAFAEVEVLKDLAGIDRIARGRKV